MSVHAEIHVAATKVRSVIELAHEADEITDQDARLQHALTGLCALVGADVGSIFVFNNPVPTTPDAGFIHGYTPSQTQAVLAEYAARTVAFDLVARNLRAQFRASAQPLAKCRRDLVDDRTWYNSPFVNDARRRWGVDDCIYSLHRIGSSSLGIGLNRSFGSTAFTVKDRALLEIFHLAIARVAADSLRSRMQSFRNSGIAMLPPRAREILDRLLLGASNKDIAEQMQISPNTVHHYCKLVFRAFEVRSRSELIARWFADATE